MQGGWREMTEQRDRPYNVDDIRYPAGMRQRPTVSRAQRQVRAERYLRRQAWRKWLGALAAYFTNLLIAGWATMVLVGIVHAKWAPNLDTLSFREAFAVAFLIRVSVRLGTRGIKIS